MEWWSNLFFPDEKDTQEILVFKNSYSYKAEYFCS